MTSEPERLGQLADGGLDAVAEGRERAADRLRQGAALGAAVGDHDARAPGGLRGGPGAAEEAAIEEEAGRAGVPQEVIGDGALIDRGRGEPPRADEAAAEVSPEPQAEPV